MYVPISLVELIFGNWMLSEPGDGDGQCFNMPVFEDIPEGAELVFIAPAPERDSLMLKYIHESFDEVPEGRTVPEVVVKEVTFRKIKVKKL